MTDRDRIVVFAGPSLPPDHRPRNPAFAWRPPAVAGDAFRLSAQRPRAVVLVDGLFDEQPAIRHKELLELIAHGVTVIGGASMGALRAAELAPFGMIGVGRIFRAFAAGRLSGDDEVALTHGPEAWGWGALTEPLVNVRATLQAAFRARIIDREVANLVLETSRAIFYKTRTWSGIVDRAEAGGGRAQAAVRALREWLPKGRVDLKRLDALACLESALTMGDRCVPARPMPPRTPFSAALIAQVRGS